MITELNGYHLLLINIPILIPHTAPPQPPLLLCLLSQFLNAFSLLLPALSFVMYRKYYLLFLLLSLSNIWHYSLYV
mgnify:CR=1 FL=1